MTVNNTNYTVEFVPNISEGRSPLVIEKIADAVRQCDGVALLDISKDPDHNRSVLTIAAHKSKLLHCAHSLYEAAISSIDLREHNGIHPRIGAVDVAPLIPLGATSMQECVALSKKVAQMVASKFQLPVYLYAKSASAPNRIKLADIRGGGFEGLTEKMALPEWEPDFGPNRPHPSAGVTVIGARFFLVAYNIVLNTPDISIARSIARTVRESSGGLAGVQAIGLFLEGRHLAQVSINLLDYHKTSIPDVQIRVIAEAAKLGVSIVDAELVGLTPKDALGGVSPESLKIANFHEGLTLENALKKANSY
jgi:glutamate formiminotransferase